MSISLNYYNNQLNINNNSENIQKKVGNYITFGQNSSTSSKDVFLSAKSILNNELNEKKEKINNHNHILSDVRKQIKKKEKLLQKLEFVLEYYKEQLKTYNKEETSINNKIIELQNSISKKQSILEKKKQETIQSLIRQKKLALKLELNEIISKPKNKLLEVILKPFIYNANVPKYYFLQSQSNEVFKNVSKWLIGKSKSNYAFIDASKVKSEKSLIKIIKAINKKANDYFSKNASNSIICIENIEKLFNKHNKKIGPHQFINNLFGKPKEKSSIEVLSNLLKQIPESKNIMLILHSKNSIEFNNVIELSESFLKDKRIGYQSILNEIKGITIKSKNLLR